MVGSDSEGLAVELNGPNSSGLRDLPASLPWLHLFSLIVANVDIHLGFSPFNKFSVSPTSCYRDTGKSSRGCTLEAHSVWQRQCPPPSTLEEVVCYFHVTQGFDQLTQAQ